jgi:hypothetical protein
MFGMPPGASHDEHAGQATVQVPVTLTNTSHAAVDYSLDSFRLLSDTDPQGAKDTRLDGPQHLRPGSAVSLRLTFSVDAAASTELRYQPPTGHPIGIPLAAVPAAAAGTTAPPAGGGHAHH